MLGTSIACPFHDIAAYTEPQKNKLLKNTKNKTSSVKECPAGRGHQWQLSPPSASLHPTCHLIVEMTRPEHFCHLPKWFLRINVCPHLFSFTDPYSLSIQIQSWNNWNFAHSRCYRQEEEKEYETRYPIILWRKDSLANVTWGVPFPNNQISQ